MSVWLWLVLGRSRCFFVLLGAAGGAAEKCERNAAAGALLTALREPLGRAEKIPEDAEHVFLAAIISETAETADTEDRGSLATPRIA
jgi:hypothetical protein